MSERSPVGAPAPTRGGRSRSAVPWLFVGAALAFALTVVVPPVAAGTGFVLVAVALIRRRLDGYGMFAIGFTIWCAVYAALAVIGVLTDGPSSGSSTYDTG